MPDDFALLLKRAKKLTDAQMRNELSSLMPFTNERLEKLFRTKVEKEKLTRLMHICRQAGGKNRRRADLLANIDELADTVVTLVSKAI